MTTTQSQLEQTETVLKFPLQALHLPASKPRVLLADDDRGIRESLGKLLRNSGYQVTLAAHGGQVLEQALNEDFDLLLLDLNMPQMDGWATLDHVQRHKPNLPVVVITAQPNQRDWMRDGGARVLMEKPLDLPLLLKTVRELLAGPKQSEDEAAAGGTRRFRHLLPKSGPLDLSKRVRGWGIND